MLIGVISDTHIPTRARAMPAEVFTIFGEVDLILHGGDLVSEAVLSELEAVAPVEAVHGNCDPPELVRRLGSRKVVRAGAARFGLVHGHRGGGTPLNAAYRAFVDQEVDCVVFGHTHRPYNDRQGERLFFNPGSATNPRGGAGYTCGLLTVEKGRVSGKIVSLERDEI